MFRVISALFGCSHLHRTFPMTVHKSGATPSEGTTTTYVVCLDCGKEFPYDWQTMRMIA